LMPNCNLWSGWEFDNFPSSHVISNFYSSFTSNLLEVR